MNLCSNEKSNFISFISLKYIPSTVILFRLNFLKHFTPSHCEHLKWNECFVIVLFLLAFHVLFYLLFAEHSTFFVVIESGCCVCFIANVISIYTLTIKVLIFATFFFFFIKWTRKKWKEKLLKKMDFFLISTVSGK